MTLRVRELFRAARGATRGGIRPAMHPRSRRCSSIKYCPIFSVVAPGDRGASPVSVLRRDFHHGLLGDVLTDVPCQDFVDEGLVPDAAPACFLAELIEHSRIDSNRNELTRFVAKRGPANAPHGGQLPGRRIGNVREINLSRRTPHARGGSPAAR